MEIRLSLQIETKFLGMHIRRYCHNRHERPGRTSPPANSHNSSKAHLISSNSYVFPSYSILYLSYVFLKKEPRRAAVAILIRVVPAPNTPVPSSASTPVPTFSEFFDQEWVKH